MVSPKVALLGQAHGHEIDQAIHLMDQLGLPNDFVFILTCGSSPFQSVPGFDGVIAQVDEEGIMHTALRVSLKKYYTKNNISKLVVEATEKAEKYSSKSSWDRIATSPKFGPSTDQDKKLWDVFENLLEIGNPKVPLLLAIESSHKTTVDLKQDHRWMRQVVLAVRTHHHRYHSIWKVRINNQRGDWVEEFEP